MFNPFSNRPVGISSMARDMLPVTPSDSEELPRMALALFVEGAGAVCFISERGEERTVNVPDHHTLTCATRQVLDTGTTATGIHAFVI